MLSCFYLPVAVLNLRKALTFPFLPRLAGCMDQFYGKRPWAPTSLTQHSRLSLKAISAAPQTCVVHSTLSLPFPQPLSHLPVGPEHLWRLVWNLSNLAGGPISYSGWTDWHVYELYLGNHRLTNSIINLFTFSWINSLVLTSLRGFLQRLLYLAS